MMLDSDRERSAEVESAVPSEPPKAILWEWLTSEEVGARGGHGYSNPAGRQYRAAWAAFIAARGVSAATGVPALPYGAAWGHTPKWPGALSLSPATVTQAVVEIGERLREAPGFTRLLILNGHVTSTAPLRTALETLRYRYPKMRIALRGVWTGTPTQATAAQREMLLGWAAEDLEEYHQSVSQWEVDRYARFFNEVLVRFFDEVLVRR